MKGDGVYVFEREKERQTDRQINRQTATETVVQRDKDRARDRESLSGTNGKSAPTTHKQASVKTLYRLKGKFPL